MNWYLKEVEADIETIQELAEKEVLVEKVIDRQVSQHVSWSLNVLIRLSQTKTADLAHAQSFTRSLANLSFTSVTTPFSQLFVQYPGGGGGQS